MRLIEAFAVIVVSTLGAGTAQAQILVGEESRDFSGADKAKVAEKEREKAIADTKAPKPVKGSRAVPATPDDDTIGRVMRDSKGVVLGLGYAGGMAAAVIASAGGKVEVPLEAFGKNNKGLVLAMTKAEFDAAVAAAGKPD